VKTLYMILLVYLGWWEILIAFHFSLFTGFVALLQRFHKMSSTINQNGLAI